MRSLIVALLLASPALPAPAAAIAPETPAEPAVQLRPGVSLAETVDSLQAVLGGAVVAELPPDPKARIGARPASASITDALNLTARSFDLFWIRRPGSLALQRRYSDYRFDAELEPEEMALVAADLYRLVHPFCIRSPQGIDREQEQFVRSLTPEQLAAIRDKGLPFRDLAPEQQRMWSVISRERGYGMLDLYLERLVRAFASWERGKLVSILLPTGERQWNFAWPNPAHPTGFSWAHFLIAPGPDDRTPVEGKGFTAPPAAKLVSRFKQPLRPMNQELTVGELVGQIEKSAGIEIRIPHYARGRRLLVSRAGAPAGGFLSALQDLYGWEFRPDRGRRYVLDRPRIPSARDAADLPSKQWAAVPPALRHLLAQDHLRKEKRMELQLSRLLSAAGKDQKPGWTEITVSKLEEPARRSLATLVTLSLLYNQMGGYMQGSTSSQWLLHPEQGIFKLEGSKPLPPRIAARVPPRGAPTATLTFSVRGPDGRTDGWGFGIPE